MNFDITFLYQVIEWFLDIMQFLIVVRVLVSWLIPQAHGPIVQIVIDATEPLLAPLRNVVPKGSGAWSMVDWSPLLALILIDITESLLSRYVVGF